MKVSDMYPSRFMKAEDFEEDESRTLTIRTVEMEELGKGKEAVQKPVIYFRDHDKAMVANKTNANIIAKLYGDDSDDWIGKRITLYAIEVQVGSDMVRAIRVKTKAPAAPVDVGFSGSGVHTNGKHIQTEVQTDKWPKFVAKAISEGIIPDDSAASEGILLGLLTAAGIESVNNLNINDCWTVVRAKKLAAAKTI